MATVLTQRRRHNDKHECHWCQQADVELCGGRPEIGCGVADDVKRDVLYLRPYTRKHAYPMEDAMRAGDSWEDWNQEADCPYFELQEEAFSFTCPSCRGTGQGGSHPDSTLSCRSCGGGGNDVVLERRYWPWN